MFVNVTRVSQSGLCVAVLLLLSAACGSVSKLSGNEQLLTPDGVITIRLLSADGAAAASATRGSVVMLEPLISVKEGAAAKILYAWDFSGLAVPSVSQAARPVVELPSGTAVPALTGTLNVSLSRDGDPLVGHYTFSIPLEAAQLAILDSISPGSVMAGLATQQFSLVVDTTAANRDLLDYHWDFGELGIPDDNSKASPTVSITAGTAASPYGGSVRVWLRYNPDISAERQFSINVVNPQLEIVADSLLPHIVTAGTQAQVFSASVNVSEEFRGKLNYSWDFAELGIPADPSLQKPLVNIIGQARPEQYLVKLTVWLDGVAGSAVSREFQVEVLDGGQDIVIVDASPGSGFENQHLSFSALIATGLPEDQLEYSWQFPAGAAALPLYSGMQPDVSLGPKAGTYKWTLSVSQKGNPANIATESFDLTILDTALAIIDTSPDYLPESGDVQFAVRLATESGYDTQVRYLWDFGMLSGGSGLDTATPSLKLKDALPGTYPALLTVWYGYDPADITQFPFTLSVLDSTAQQLKILDVSPKSAFPGNAVSLAALLSNPQSKSVNYGWHFVNWATPQESTAAAPMITTVAGPGDYPGSLTVTTVDQLQSDELAFTFSVLDPQLQVIDTAPDSAVQGTSVTFVAVIGNLAGDAVQYLWDFGAAATVPASEERTPTVTIGPAGQYTCTLTIARTAFPADPEIHEFELLILAP